MTGRNVGYEQVYFAIGKDADRYLRRILENKANETLEFMAWMYHNLGEHVVCPESNKHINDSSWEMNGYILSWDAYAHYIRLEFKRELNDEDRMFH